MDALKERPMPDAPETLAAALDRAFNSYVPGGGSIVEHLLAAVTAHALSAEAVERAAKAARPDAWAEDGEIGKLVSADAKAKYYSGLRKVVIARTRAAIAAALDVTGGRDVGPT